VAGAAYSPYLGDIYMTEILKDLSESFFAETSGDIDSLVVRLIPR